MPLNIDWQQILLHVFNLIILAAGLTFLLFKPVRKFMRAREEKYKKTAEEHARKKAEIEELEKEREEKISGLDGELESHRRAVLAQTEKRNRQLVADAEKQVRQILDEGRKKAEDERAAYIATAGDDIADMVVKSAEKLLAMESTPANDRSLYDSYLKAAQSDVTVEGLSEEAKRTLAARLAYSPARTAEGRSDVRTAVADMVEDAARAAAERTSSPEGDSALYDEFLKSVGGGGND